MRRQWLNKKWAPSLAVAGHSGSSSCFKCSCLNSPLRGMSYACCGGGGRRGDCGGDRDSNRGGDRDSDSGSRRSSN